MVNEDININEDIREDIIYPFTSKDFKQAWEIWKDYKKKEHGFKYKSAISEQAALNKLFSISRENEGVARSIIRESISNGWEGLFEMRDNNRSGKVPDDYKKQVFKDLTGDEK